MALELYPSVLGGKPGEKGRHVLDAGECDVGLGGKLGRRF